MLTKFFLGPPGFESDRRLMRQMILCVVWVFVSLLELYMTSRTPATTGALSWFWGVLLILSVTMTSFGYRIVLDRRRAAKSATKSAMRKAR